MHIFTPGFGFSFSGQTFVLKELFKRWKYGEIPLSWYGTSYPFLKDSNGPAQNTVFAKRTRSSRLFRIFYNIKLWANLIVKKNKYDIIQVHNIGWGGLIAPVIAHWMGKKAIYLMSLQGSDNPGKLLSESWGSFKLSLFKRYDGVIGLSPALVDDCRKFHFQSQLLVLPNFLSFDPLTVVDRSERNHIRTVLGIPETGSVLLFVGSVIMRKGFDLLISSFINLSKGNQDLWLVVVGPNNCRENPRLDEEFVNQQREKLKKAGLEKQVVWIGMINDQKLLAGYYQASDIFMFPSRAEGQGNVILEAMAAGLPIVSTHLVGVTDMMVEQEQQGFLIPKDDIDGFIQATKLLLEDHELRLKMGTLGRLKVLRDFSYDGYARKLSEFYFSIINTPWNSNL